MPPSDGSSSPLEPPFFLPCTPSPGMARSLTVPGLVAHLQTGSGQRLRVFASVFLESDLHQRIAMPPDIRMVQREPPERFHPCLFHLTSHLSRVSYQQVISPPFVQPST